MALCCGVFIVTGGAGELRAQVSPGPLSRAHSSLEGAEKCLECHGRGEDALSENCTSCHAEIEFQRAHGLGLHGTQSGADCAACHPEHAGVDFELIDWGADGRAGFEHARTGWRLEGRHASTECRECHRREFQTSPVAGLIQGEDRGRSWLGLERRCLACHADHHRGDLGSDCAGCHEPAAWTPATGFDHSASSFPLTGKHAGVDCNACHLVPGRVFSRAEDGGSAPRFRPVDHGECSACHADTHEGRLGPACGTCHVTDGFRQVSRKDFDHARTRFPLIGGHGSVACEDCHDPVQAGGKRPAFGSCAGCHADPHAGRATVRGRAADCSACHDESGFERSTFTVGRHRDSAFPLEGRHAHVACESCHPSRPAGVPADALGTAGVLLRPPHDRCSDCHRDAHAGQLASRPDGGACESCHTVDGWRPSTFGADRHAALGLPLAGRHADIECAACHAETRPGLPSHSRSAELGSARVALGLLDADCASCHLDPHAGRFAAGGDRPFEAGCPACHDARRFRPSAVDAVVHSRFGYPLEGAHVATPCSACHAELILAAASSSLVLGRAARELRFEARHESCEDCHDSPHGTQFAERIDGGACAGCHDAATFRPASRFDHERDAAFPLTGAHARVPCRDCHRVAVSGEVIYRPVPRRCRDCHAGTPGGGSP
jgi:hypothetical protein